jgi:class 3 adenylate cyclase/pimeloyl-ACP methyl ester carboxylesterase
VTPIGSSGAPQEAILHNGSVDVPETRYAKTGDGLKLAYQVFGSGPNLIAIPPLLSNVELSWDHEVYRRVYEHWGRHVRFAQFDKRGIGGSDRFEAIPTLEQRIGDIVTVMDATGMERASLLGLSEGGLMAQLFAVRYPERVDRIVLANSAAASSHWEAVGLCVLPGEEIKTIEQVFESFQSLVDSWGDDPQYMVDWMMPSQSTNAPFVRWIGRMQRQSATPADVARQVEAVLHLGGVDPADISAPTLVVQVHGDRVIQVSTGRFLADRIPGAELLEVPGSDHFLWAMSNWREFSDHALEFVLGSPVSSGSERRFATVLFTDLVNSTRDSSAAGDRAWSNILDSHDRICRDAIESHQGRMIKSTGDGLLATFDAPSHAVRTAAQLVQELGAIGLTIRAGIHAGEVNFRDDGDLSGTTVNLAARVEERAQPGSVFVSSTVRELLLGGEQVFTECGDFELKGLPGTWSLYRLET